MKIVFWSPVHGQAGTTSNLLTISILMGLLYEKKCLLTHTHFTLNNLEAPLVGSNSKDVETSSFFQDVGLDALIRNFKAAKLKQEDIENCCISFPDIHLCLLPGTSKRNRISFEYEMDLLVLSLLKNMEESMDIVFVDLCSGHNSLSSKIISEADLTVINLSQNIELMDTYFSSFEKVLPGNKFYLIGNYDSKSKYNLNNLQRRYRKYIKTNNSGVIPYNTAFLDALNDGRIIDFVKDNLRCEKGDENLCYIFEAKKATEKIYRFVERIGAKGERGNPYVVST
ncbi:MAG: hypothetical protein GX306_06125 [Clostridiales bacterium]|nr:hypothetical protein [Clostridiales bacterium]